jgi:hypothetical protein
LINSNILPRSPNHLVLQRDFLEFTLLTAYSVPSIGASPV